MDIPSPPNNISKPAPEGTSYTSASCCHNVDIGAPLSDVPEREKVCDKNRDKSRHPGTASA